MALYTQEQIEQANSVNLEEYLICRGEKLKRTGKESQFYYRDSGGEHDSISVCGNRWYDHKNQTGGYPVKFLQEFYGLGFREAVRELLNGDTPVYQGKNLSPSESGSTEGMRQEAPKLVLPEKAENMNRLYAYLLKTRLLSREVVKAFVDAGLLYQEGKYNNIVFVGTDAEGNPKSASLKSSSSGAKGFRMTVSGSNPDYGFCWRGGGERLFVFEAAVDLLSFLTLYPKDWQKQNYIALDGLSPKAMLRFLQEQGGISEIYPCLDNDPAGIETCDKLKDLLLERGYTAEQVLPLSPAYKDWNECLKAKNGIAAQPAQSHPKKDAYKKTVRQLENLNRNTEAPNLYCKWRNRQFEKAGQAFYLQRIVKEWEEIQKAGKSGGMDNDKRMLAGAVRIADFAAHMLCGLEKGCTYRGALSCCLKSIADMALRLTVYLQTDYALEMERRNSFQTREKPPPEEMPEETPAMEQDLEKPSMAW